MSNQIQIDYALSMDTGVGAAGLTEAQLDELSQRFHTASEAVQARAQGGDLGFWGLPRDDAALERVRRVAAALPAQPSDVLWLGIGGSSLGVRALLEALCPPATANDQRPRIHLPDNSDPWLLSHLLQTLSPERTLAVVVSKSGGTVETAAQMLVVQDWLRQALGAGQAARRMVAITDPSRGTLRELAEREKWATLAIPGNVGGRFSVLTPVGLLPAVLRDLDADALLAGAAAMAERCRSPHLRENPAGVLAALHYLHDREKGHGIHVMMPYTDRLRAFAGWYVQLWAESLGKRLARDGSTVESGPTPLVAVGATDQHAQMQLFMEGPRNKLVTFVEVSEPAGDLAIPAGGGDHAYLGGKTLGQLLDAERRGTTEALARDGRPSLTVRLPRLDAYHLGELLFVYQAATAFSGELYGIDAFDQPGVELGKRLAFALLGRSGYETESEMLAKAGERSRDRHRV